MARLGRGDPFSFGHSRLRPPAVVGEVVPPTPPFAPVQVHLASRLTAVTQQQRAPHSRLRPPTVVTPFVPPTEPSRPLEVRLAATASVSDQRRRGAKKSLPGLLPVIAGRIYRIKVTLASQPTVVGQVRRLPHSVLRKPAVVATTPAVFVAAPVDTHVAASPAQARGPHSVLRKPAVVDPAVVPGFVAPKPAVHTAATPRVGTLPHSLLRKPTVLDPAIVFRPVEVKSAALQPDPTSRRAAHSVLHDPAVVCYRPSYPTLEYPFVTGVYAVGQTLTADPGVYSGTAPITVEYQWMHDDGLGGPLTEIPGETNQTLLLTSGETGRLIAVRVTLTNACGSNIFTTGPSGPVTSQPLPPPLSVTLAAVGRALEQVRHAGHPTLRRPAKINPAVTFQPVSIYFEQAVRAPVDTAERRGSHYTLRPPPKVIGAARVVAPIRLTQVAVRTAWETRRRKPNPELRRPTAVLPAGSGPGVICLTPAGTDVLTMTGAVADALTLAAAGSTALTLASASADALTLTPASTDSLTLTPVVPDTC